MNERDFEDAVARGEKKGDDIFNRAMRKWKRVDTETKIGIALAEIARAGVQIPGGQMKQLEARYGESKS